MKKLLPVLFFVTLALNTFASYIENLPITVTQPDGTVVHCFASGDEFYNWVHDANGFTLIRDPQTGVVVYAKLLNGELVSTEYRVESVDPASIGLRPWTNISAERREQRRADFLSRMPPPSRSEGEEVARAGQNNGTINNIVIYIRFATETEFPAKANTYEDMFNKDEANYPSQYRYFKDMSHGNTLIPSTFYPAHSGNVITSYQDIHPRSYYQPYNAVTNTNGYRNDNESREREHSLLERAILAVKSEIEAAALNLDFNNDGDVDNICFIVRGSPGGWSDLLWPHRWSLYTKNVYIGSKRVWDFNFQLETHLDANKASVLAHEMFHTLGAPDFYRYVNTSFTPVGSWDLMASNTTPPQSSTAYVKYKYGGWIDSIPEITQNGTYTLNNVCSPTNNAYKIASPNSATEFFVIEYRDKNVYWESAIPGSGLLIYRVNTLVRGNAQGPPDELYIFRPGGTNNTTNGTINSAHFSSTLGRTTFNNTSNPPCFLSNNSPGGINISNISAFGGATMSFYVSITGFNITATANGGGTIYPSGSIAAEPGSSKTFTFSADPGKVIDAVLVNGVNVPEAVISGSYTFTNIMTSHTISVFFGCPTQSMPITESFDATTFPPDCWLSQSASGTPWKRVSSSVAETSPSCSPRSGAGMLHYDCWNYPEGSKGLLITPKIEASGKNSKLSFWMYRENVNQYGGVEYLDKVNVYLSTTPTITGLPLLTIHRCRLLDPVESDNGWYEYILDLPTDSMERAYVIFEGVSDYGNNIYMDDIEIADYIIAEPIISVSPTTLSFEEIEVEATSVPQTITVSGENLIGNITYTQTGTDAGAFTITEASWNPATGGTLNITFSPTQARTYTAILTLSSTDAENVAVSLTGTGILMPVITEITTDASEICLGEQVVVTAHPSENNDGTNPVYTWYKNDDRITGITGASFIDTLTSADTFTYNATVKYESTGYESVLNPEIAQTVIVNPNPIVSSIYTEDEILCYGETTTVTVEANGGTPPYTYYYGAESNENGIFEGIEAGTHTFTIADANGCTATATIAILNLELLTVIITATKTTICEGDAITFTAHPTPDSNPENPYNYLWTLNGDILPFNGDMITIANELIIGVNNIEVRVEHTYESASCFCLDTILVTVVPQPTLTIYRSGAQYDVCKEVEAEIMVNLIITDTVIQNASQYTWNDGESGQYPIYSRIIEGFESTGIYNYSLEISFENSTCAPVTSNVLQFNVVESPQWANLDVNPKWELCLGEEVDLHAEFLQGTTNAINIGTIQWQYSYNEEEYIGEPDISLGGYTTHTPLNPGFYTYQVNYTSSDPATGCTLAPEVFGTVAVFQQPVIDSIAIDYSEFCSDGSITLTAYPNPTNPETGSVYTWYKNGAEIAGVTGATFIDHPETLDHDGTEYTYHAIVTYEFSGCQSALVEAAFTTITHTITATADSNGTIDPSGEQSVNCGEHKTFAFLPDLQYRIHQVLVDGVNSPDAVENGIYTFENVTADHTIHVIFETVGIEENEFENVKIYSYQNSVYIKIVETHCNASLRSVEILDMTGRLIYQSAITNIETVIPLHVATGIYNVRLISQNNAVMNAKVSIMKL